MISPAQLRAARGLLGWTQKELASRAGISDRTIRLFELEVRVPHMQTVDALESCLSEAGVKFSATENEVGVMMPRQSKSKAQRVPL